MTLQRVNQNNYIVIIYKHNVKQILKRKAIYNNSKLHILSVVKYLNCCIYLFYQYIIGAVIRVSVPAMMVSMQAPAIAS